MPQPTPQRLPQSQTAPQQAAPHPAKPALRPIGLALLLLALLIAPTPAPAQSSPSDPSADNAASDTPPVRVEHRVRPTLRHLEITATASDTNNSHSNASPGRLAVMQGVDMLGLLDLRDTDRDTLMLDIPLVPDTATQTRATPIRVVDEQGHELARFEMPDTWDRRIALVRRAELHSHATFAEDTFPQPEFAEPGWIESLVGPFEIDARFFDNDYREVTRPDGPGRYGVVMTLRPTTPGVEPITRYMTLYRFAEHPDWTQWHDVTLAPPASFGIDPDVAKAAAPALNDMAKWEMTDKIEHDFHGAAMFGVLANASPEDAPFEGRNEYWNLDEEWWLGLKRQLGRYEQPYLSYPPEGFDANANEANDTADNKWPLILYLHGAPQRGEDLERLKTAALPAAMEAGLNVPAFVVAPQTQAGSFWVPARMNALIDDLIARYPIDPERVYLTGDNMGAFGVWFVASFYPQRFAAIAPVGGGGEVDLVGRIAQAGVPIRMYHVPGENGQANGLIRSLRDTAREAGGQADVELLDVPPPRLSDAVYSGHDIYDWLLAQ